MTRDLVDEGIAAGCLEWVPDDLYVRAIPRNDPPIRDEHIPLTVLFSPAPMGGVQAVACASDRDELDAWVARYLREYPPGGYGTMVLAGPYREAQHWAVKMWRGCECE